MAEPKPLASSSTLQEVHDRLALDASRPLDAQDALVASEIAYQAGDFASAVAAMRIATALAAGDASLTLRLAQCLERHGDMAAAELHYRQALAFDPALDSAHQSLIHLFVGRSDTDAALRQIAEQQRHCGDSPGLARQLVAVLNTAGRQHDALAVIARRNEAPDPSEADLRSEAELASHLGYAEQALKVAHAAWLRYPESAELGMLLARLLCAARRFQHAADVLARVLDLDPGNHDARHLLASALTEAGQYQAALRLMLALIHARPGSGALWHQAAVIANLSGYPGEAISLLAKAIDLDPRNAELHLLRGHLLGHVGRHGEALEMLDNVEALKPGDSGVRDLKIAFLQQMGDALPGVPGAGLIRPLPRLRQRQRDEFEAMRAGGWRGFVPMARLQLRVIAGLVLREISHRTAQSKLGALSAIIEPVAQIAMLGVVLTVFNHGKPPLGNELFFFYATGVMPFYLFIHVIDHNMNVFSDNRNLLQVPIINRLDLVISHALAELVIDGATTALVFGGFYLTGHGERSDNVAGAVAAFASVWLLAFGLALNLAVLNNLNRFTQRAWTTVQRVLYFLSGIFFLAAGMPDWVRDMLVWNPLLLCIEWFREGFFPQYAPPWLHRGYVLGVSGALVVTGLMLERVSRRAMRSA